jgi:AcrR family transcriptional regulator
LSKNTAGKPVKPTEDRQRGARLRPEERERAILSGAEAFFAEHGFDATTRELADYLGVRQSLLYRYFPTKQDLIDRIYNDIFVGRWDPSWPAIIKDRTVPLVQRLTRFYELYIPTTLTRQWLRLFYQAGLKGFDISSRYHELLSKEIFVPLCYELRAAYGVDLADLGPPTSIELEVVYDLHGAAVYKGVRQHIYGMEIHPDSSLFNIWIESFINNVMPAAYRQLAASRGSGKEGSHADKMTGAPA